ncbi:DRTGG domain-containing protein [Dehalococcoidia bacterium]|nr:DRTGG domain-containing protein [Dehalococcoidia bacterium]
MKLADIISIVEGTLITANADLDMDVSCACGADLMSDVLTYARSGSLLLTGLTNPQVVRTAEMAEIVAIVFVRGKRPPLETIALAEEKGIPLVTTKYTMFEMCGRLFEAGMNSCDVSPNRVVERSPQPHSPQPSDTTGDRT